MALPIKFEGVQLCRTALWMSC